MIHLYADYKTPFGSKDWKWIEDNQCKWKLKEEGNREQNYKPVRANSIYVTLLTTEYTFFQNHMGQIWDKAHIWKNWTHTKHLQWQ